MTSGADGGPLSTDARGPTRKFAKQPYASPRARVGEGLFENYRWTPCPAENGGRTMPATPNPSDGPMSSGAARWGRTRTAAGSMGGRTSALAAGRDDRTSHVSYPRCQISSPANNLRDNGTIQERKPDVKSRRQCHSKPAHLVWRAEIPRPWAATGILSTRATALPDGPRIEATSPVEIERFVAHWLDTRGLRMRRDDRERAVPGPRRGTMTPPPPSSKHDG
jgi:hypothetical protein